MITPGSRVGSAPYAIRALSAASADALSDDCEECVTDEQIGSVDGSKVTGTVPNAANATNAANADTLDNMDSALSCRLTRRLSSGTRPRSRRRISTSAG